MTTIEQLESHKPTKIWFPYDVYDTVVVDDNYKELVYIKDKLFVFGNLKLWQNLLEQCAFGC